MIRRALAASVVVLFMALALPLTARAQSIFILAGPTFPIGDFADYAKTGWFTEAGFTYPVGENGLWVGVAGSYGQNKHDEVDGVSDRTDLIGAMGLVGYDIPTEGNINPYVWGGGGLLVHRYVPETGDSESDSNFGYQVGAGISVGGADSNVHPFLEGRFEGSKDSKFVAAEVGVSIGVGGSDDM